MMIPPEHEARLRLLVRNFLAENVNVNLSAFRTEEACWTGNVEDSLALLDVADRFETLDRGRVIDVGTGGGFPLMPLAVCLPGTAFVGLDSTRKKVEAVRRIVEATGIDNVEALVPERAEVAGHQPDERERYDAALARAIGPLSVLLEYCSPFVRVGGHLVIWKSLHIDEELSAARHAEKSLGCEMEDPHRYDLGPEWGERQLLIYRKVEPTSPGYPRPVGQAKKHPL